MAIIRKYKFKIKCNHCDKIDCMARGDTNLSKIKCSHCHKVGTTKYIKVKRHKTLSQFRLEHIERKK